MRIETGRIMDRILAAGAGRRIPSARCVVCGEATNDGKPWCLDHVASHSPYARQVAKGRDRRRREIARVEARPESARSNSPVAEDLLATLAGRGGSASIARLAKDNMLSVKVATAYMSRLEARGQVTTKPTRRSRVICTLVAGSGHVSPSRLNHMHARARESSS